MKEARLEIIQGYFDMLDTNKWLLFNAMNTRQEKQAREFEKNVLDIINDLTAPLPIA